MKKLIKTIIRIFWYSYFIVYLGLKSFSLIKIKLLRKKDEEKSLQYAFEKAREISKHVLKRTKTNIVLVGEENIPEGACVFIPNHEAIFDGFVMIAFINKPFGFIAKMEILKIPLISHWHRAIKTVFIDRDNPRDSVRVINKGVEQLKKGHSMVIFPEGTRSLCSEMGEFKKGSMKLALKAKVPIVPVTLDGTYKVLETGDTIRRNTIKITFHKAIYTDNISKEEEKNLAANIENIVRTELYKIRE